MDRRIEYAMYALLVICWLSIEDPDNSRRNFLLTVVAVQIIFWAAARLRQPFNVNQQVEEEAEKNVENN